MTKRYSRLLLSYLPVAFATTLVCGHVVLAGVAGQGLVDNALIGTQLTYEVHYTSDGYTEISTAIGATAVQPRHNLHASLLGIELLTILDRRGTSTLVSVRFIKPLISIQVDGQSQPQRERDTVANLPHLAYVYMDAQSRVERVEFPQDYSEMASNFVKAIVLTQQFSLASGGQITPTWETREAGPAGPYIAQYRIRERSGQAIRLLKTISVVDSRPGDTGSNGVVTVPRGTVDVEVNMNQGTVNRLEASVHEDMFVGGNVLSAEDTALTLRVISRTRLRDTVLLDARQMFQRQHNTLSASVQPSLQAAAEREKTIQRQILGADSAQSLLKAIPDLDRPGSSTDRGIGLYLKLKALIYLRPADVKVVAKGLSTGDLSNQSASAILTALVTVGSSEAQDAICDVVRARNADVQALTVVVPALGLVRAPAPRVVSLLQELSRSSSRETRSTALLALGAAAKNLAPDAPSRSAAVVSDLMTRLSAGTDDKSTLLLALGNTGSAVAKSAILSQRGDKSPMVRRTVTAALGGFQSAETDQALCDMLMSDEDSQVRAAAAQALTTRKGMAVAKETLALAALRDIADNVRLASMFALRDLLGKDPSVRQVILTVAEKDRSEAVRKQATSLLQGGNSQK